MTTTPPPLGAPMRYQGHTYVIAEHRPNGTTLLRKPTGLPKGATTFREVECATAELRYAEASAYPKLLHDQLIDTILGDRRARAYVEEQVAVLATRYASATDGFWYLPHMHFIRGKDLAFQEEQFQHAPPARKE